MRQPEIAFQPLLLRVRPPGNGQRSIGSSHDSKDRDDNDIHQEMKPIHLASRVIHRAGLTPWPRLFHNLRSTRQTELAEKFPSHVVCDWLGNSEDIARKHYLQITDEHFQRAMEPAASGRPSNPTVQCACTRAAKSGAVSCRSGR